MSVSEGCPVSADLPGYLLGALEHRERERVETHLDDCPACAAELLSLRVSRDALTLAAPPVAPPSALKGSVMQEVRREADLFAAARAPEPRPQRSRRWRVPSFAAAAAAALGLAFGVLVLDGDGTEPRTVAAEVSAAAPAGSGATLTLEDDSARLQVRGLPAPGPNRVYQVWVQSADGSVRPTEALFDVGDDGVGTTAVPEDLRPGQRVLVTSEPAGGSSRPTREPILSASV